jgi:hypothetical protein
MSKRSSAWFISYDLRPGKQIERRIVLESLQAARTAGFVLDHFPFIGMGGFRFIDFLLANRILGLRKFTSIEHDEDIVGRCEFNKPFNDMFIYSGTSSEYVNQVGFKEPSIVWFDYERGISSDLRNDMLSLAGNIVPGSFIFITATAELPEKLKRIRGIDARLKQLQEDISPFGDGLTPSELSPAAFHGPAARILRAALSFGFVGRSDGIFFPYLRLNYKDTTWMMTIGGYFGSRAEIARLRTAFVGKCDFLRPTGKQFVYQVEQFNITDAERRLLDRASIAPKNRRSEKMVLRKLGLRGTIIDQYSELMRFIPRYFESVL